MTFADNLKRLRRERGYGSAKALSDALAIPYTTYIGYENAGREPSFSLLCRIAAALSTSPDVLLGYTAEADPFRKALRTARERGLVVFLREGKAVFPDILGREGMMTMEEGDFISFIEKALPIYEKEKKYAFLSALRGALSLMDRRDNKKAAHRCP